jgi:hypothetical protein
VDSPLLCERLGVSAPRQYVFGTECFVKHPLIRGFWIKTHVCVVLVACQHCKAAVGEPCRSSSRAPRTHSGDTHWVRRAEGKLAIKHLKKGTTIVVR